MNPESFDEMGSVGATLTPSEANGIGSACLARLEVGVGKA